MNKEDLKKDVLYFDQQEGCIVKFIGFDEVGRARFEEIESGMPRLRPTNWIIELDGKHVKGMIETMTETINMHARIQHKICEQLDEKEKQDYINTMRSLGNTLSTFDKK